MTTYALNVTGLWTDLHSTTGQDLGVGFLIYCDGGNVAVATSEGEPSNLVYGTEAYQGEQIAAGGDGLETVWVRATTGGAAKIKVQTSSNSAATKTLPTPGNRVSVLNSTATPLSSGATFTGEWTDGIAYDDLVVAAASDQNGTLRVQFSTDGVNVDSTLTRQYRTDLIEVPHRFTITRRYFRVTFENTSASTQTNLRLQPLVGNYSPLNAPIGSTLAQDFDATVVRPTDPDNEAVLGLRQGTSPFLKFGYNDDISSAAPEVVASFGGTFTPLSTATTLTLVSSSASDTSAGVGARSLFIQGLDSTRRYQFEFVTLNGTTPVVTTNTWLGVNRIMVFSSGTSQTNVGNISCTATTGGTNQARIPAGTGVTQQLIFHTQDGHQGLIRQVTLNVLKLTNGSAPRVTISMNVWNPKVTNSRYVLRRYKLDTAVFNDLVRTYKIPIKLDPTEVVWMTAETTQNATIVDGEMDILEVRQAAT